MIAIISLLHAEPRAFDFYFYIIYHLSAGVFQWSQEKGVLGEDQFNLLQESKTRVRSIIKERTHISVDVRDPTGKGGTTTTQNVAHAMLSNEKIYKFWYPQFLMNIRSHFMNV